MTKYIIVKQFPLITDSTITRQTLPRYDLRAWAGIKSMLIEREDVEDRIEIEGVPPCSGAIPVYGDSMEPLCSAGDVALYKVTPSRRGGLYFGNPYVVVFDDEGETSISVKYLYMSDQRGYYRLESENPDYKPVEIPIDNVRLLGLVKAFVRPVMMSI